MIVALREFLRSQPANQIFDSVEIGGGCRSLTGPQQPFNPPAPNGRDQSGVVNCHQVSPDTFVAASRARAYKP